MNKVYLIGLILIIMLFVPITLKHFKTKEKQKNILELTYSINAGIPFKWEVEVEDKSIVKYVKNYVVKDENKGALVGAKVYKNYVFEGLKEGTTTIKFKYINFTDNIVSEEITHKVKVDENKNIILIDEE